MAGARRLAREIADSWQSGTHLHSPLLARSLQMAFLHFDSSVDLTLPDKLPRLQHEVRKEGAQASASYDEVTPWVFRWGLSDGLVWKYVTMCI